jgi:GH15 family glucan-1,4-alpha-glucosidase
MTITPAGAGPPLTLGGTIPLGVLGARSYGRTTLTAGQSAFVALSWGDGQAPADLDEAFAALNTTIHYWRDWLSAAKIPDHPWKPYVDRSALTLKGLSYAPTGAIMAAATTSLPETPGGARNWDYRFTWIRDSAFMLRSLYHWASTGRRSSTGASSSTRSAGVTSTRSSSCRSCTASAANAT